MIRWLARPLTNRWVDLILAGGLILAGWKFTANLTHLIDIGLYDESDYLYAGAGLLHNGFPDPQWAPLYALWYFLLSLIQPDRVALYFLNYQLITILLPVALYVALRRGGVAAPPAAVIAFFALIGAVNLPVWPKVSHFALIVMLVTLAVAAGIRSPAIRWAVLCGGALLAAYVRPEFFLSFVLLVVGFVIVLARSEESRTRRLAAAGSVGGLTVLLLLAWGAPVGGGDRSFGAFAQHFARNWVAWSGSDLSPWTDWQAIMAQNFGAATSIAQAALNNPPMFARHIATNLLAAPGDLYRLLFVHANLLLPARWNGLEAFGLLVLALGLLIGTRGQWLPHLRVRLGGQRWLWIALAGFALPALLALALIYPRAHYLEVVGIAAVVGVVVITRFEARGQPQLGQIHESAPPGSSRTVGLVGTLALALILVTPSPWYLLGAPRAQQNLATIRYLQELAIHEPVNLLEAKGGFPIYVGDNYRRVREVDKAVPYAQFAREQGINMVVLEETLRNDSRFRDDPEWQAFLADPVAAGFSVLAIPDTNRTLLVATSLLQ